MNDITFSDINSFTLYLHIVGGHSMIINLGGGILLKGSSNSEIDLYTNFQNFPYFPKLYGVIKNSSTEFTYIIHFVSLCKLFFQNYIKSKDIQSQDINVEGDQEFDINFKSFLETEFTEGIPCLDTCCDHSNYFSSLETQLNTLDQVKSRWILFWFVKWWPIFLKNDYIALEDLTYEYENPAIIDIKLGAAVPKNNKVKAYTGSIVDLGCRLMGLETYQKDVTFKSRYHCKNMDSQCFVREIKSFFTIGDNILHDLIRLVIHDTELLISEIRKIVQFEVAYSSLLICYDWDFFKNSNVNVSPEGKYTAKLIDFSFFERVVNKPDQTDVVEPTEKQRSVITALNNLVQILEKIDSNEII